MASENRQPSDVDRHVGVRIRLARQLKQMSQEKLANELGITFQQVQKYERGRNRVSAGRLFQLCQALDVDLNFFFDGLDMQTGASVDAERVENFMGSPLGVELAAALANIPDTTLQRSLLRLIQAAGDERA
ncbi:helix-turn-helix transcriptional regulator [Glycocaulis profundi]|jgi:transcriptional regulator with XRE-family HTH domain|nr:helix-turn-helix transcriptional regulator [Glycocaulis profundi]